MMNYHAIKNGNRFAVFGSLDKDIERYQEIYSKQKISQNFIQKIVLIVRYSGLFAIANHRFGCWILKNYGSYNKRYIRYLFNALYYAGKKLSIIWGKIEIEDGLPIGPGFFISNTGGVIIGASFIGENCTIGSAVTIGMGLNGEHAKIGSNIVVGTNSVIYGDLTIGDGCVIEKDTVLTKSTPANVLIKGNPAKIINKNINSNVYIRDLI